ALPVGDPSPTTDRDGVVKGLTRLDNIYNTLRVDQWGRRWVPEYVDADFIELRLDAYANANDAPDWRGNSLGIADVADASYNAGDTEVDGAPSLDDDTLWWDTPLSCSYYSNWSCGDCDGDSNDDTYVYAGE